MRKNGNSAAWIGSLVAAILTSLAVAAWLAVRRWTGHGAAPSTMTIMLVAVALVGLTLLARFAMRRIAADCSHPLLRLSQILLSGALILAAGAVAIPNAPTAGLIALCVLVTAEETWWWSFARRKELSSIATDTSCAPPVNAHAMQQSRSASHVANADSERTALVRDCDVSNAGANASGNADCEDGDGEGRDHEGHGREGRDHENSGDPSRDGERANHDVTGENAVESDADRDVEGEGDELLLPDGVSQQWTRANSGSHGEVLEGLMRATFAPGQKIATLHAAFCPPMASVPSVDTQWLAGEAASVSVALVQPFGARLEVKLARPAKAATEAIVLVTATCSSAELVRPSTR